MFYCNTDDPDSIIKTLKSMGVIENVYDHVCSHKQVLLWKWKEKWYCCKNHDDLSKEQYFMWREVDVIEIAKVALV